MATYTDNYQLTKPTYAEQADIGVVNSNMNKIDEVMHSSQISLAPAYDSTKSYAVGDKVMYELLMYKCISPTTGVWDASKWERTTASESGGGGSAELDILGEGNGAVVSFADGASAELAKCIVEIVPKQAGSGTPSSDNVRAISGYTAVKVDVSGKNLINVDAPTVPNAALNSNGEWTASNYYNGFVFKGGFVYTLSMTKGSGFDTLRYAVRTGGTGARQTYNMNAPLVIDATLADEVRIVLGKSDFATNVQLEISSDATTYEAYAGSTTTTPLGQTVYGGWLNVLTGELTIDREIITITSESQFTTFSADSTYGSLVTIASDGKADNSNIMSISDMALGISNNDSVSPDYVSLDRCYIDDNGRVRLRASKDVTISTKADMLARFLNAQVVYILATPQTVQLTGQEVNSILGQNNISADTGDVDIVYVKASAPIQPNPTGTPTATLKKLGIGGTVFEVEGGGGGGSSEEVYDNTERTSGTYFGKPRYRISFTVNAPSGAGTHTIATLSNYASLDKVIKIEGMLNNSSYAYVMPYADGNIDAYLSYDKTTGNINFIVKNDNWSGYTIDFTIYYTKITD